MDEFRNIIQVFGLPRSGTNYIEWLIINNFENLNYKNIYVIGNVKGLYNYKKNEILKHTYPNLNYSDYAIIIYKEYEAWLKSINRYRKYETPKKIYDEYMKCSNELNENSDRVILVEHLYAYENHINVLKNISNLINKPLKSKILKPIYKLNKGGADVSETNKIFKL